MAQADDLDLPLEIASNGIARVATLYRVAVAPAPIADIRSHREQTEKTVRCLSVLSGSLFDDHNLKKVSRDHGFSCSAFILCIEKSGKPVVKLTRATILLGCVERIHGRPVIAPERIK